ncbi:hypothetical protein JTB14_012957 [Gonioctena quinquepunctata]|nr:hypothetical protein JTB14_012957 [Gonioctena quinquepunctata]
MARPVRRHVAFPGSSSGVRAYPYPPAPIRRLDAGPPLKEAPVRNPVRGGVAGNGDRFRETDNPSSVSRTPARPGTVGIFYVVVGTGIIGRYEEENVSA